VFADQAAVLDCQRVGFRRDPCAAGAAQTRKRISPERSE
jgi:hypothetical protein